MAKQNLTTRFVETVQATASQEDFWDTKVKGFGLRVSRLGKKTWFVFYRYAGRKRRMGLGVFPAVPLHEARNRALDTLRRVYDGCDPIGAADREITFNDLADRFMSEHSKVHKLSWREDQRCLDKDIRPFFGAMPIRQIRKQHIIESLQKTAQRNVPIQVNRNFCRLRKIFNFAVERDLLEHSPCAGLKKPFKETSRDRVLSDGEIKKIRDAIPKLTVSSGNLLTMLLICAQRSKEVKLMRWQDLDLAGLAWNLPGEFTKNGKPHLIPITEAMKEIIQAQVHTRFTSPWVFPSRSDHSKPWQNHQKSLQRLTKLSGVQFNGHDFRRTAATTMAKLGVNRLVISKLLNHSESSITAIYDRHSYESEKRNALETWCNHLVSVDHEEERIQRSGC